MYSLGSENLRFRLEVLGFKVQNLVKEDMGLRSRMIIPKNTGKVKWICSIPACEALGSKPLPS